MLACVKDRIGLEIGGPSTLFSPEGQLAVYPCAARIDNVNFAADTAWASALHEGDTFRFDPSKPPGHQYLREATSLAGIADNTYDFVLSAHCLEHVANPLAALREWRRVLRPGGHLILALPNPRWTFDHRRPCTTIQHLRDDFRLKMQENDLTHLEEILALHDLNRDPAAGTPQQFRQRSHDNATNRCLHHHVFDLDLIRAILAETGWIVEQQERVRPLHLLTLAHNRPGA